MVELLVVIAIIGILVALLLPAVQAAREAARRTSCSNNLKNMGVAILNHHDIHRHFPISHGAAFEGEAPDNVDQSGVGWIVEVLPQLEEQALYDQFVAGGAFEGKFFDGAGRRPRVNQGLGSIKNGISVPELMSTQLDVLQCPSDVSVTELSRDQFQWKFVPVALTSYKGVLGDTWLGEGWGSAYSNDTSVYRSGIYNEPPPPYATQYDCHNNTRCRGIFWRHTFQKPVKISRVTDGTSHTFMVGEDVPAYNRHSAAYYANGDWCSCNIPLNNLINFDPVTLDLEFWWDQQSFRSRHPGGAQFCLADGSVRFVLDSVDNVVYRVSCTRDSGEAVSTSF